MTKYSNYIELSPHYESVADIDSDIRNPAMWQNHIVNKDKNNVQLSRNYNALDMTDLITR